jgi:signal transduction histidine kinase
MFGRARGISVGRRLGGLVAAEVLTALALLALGLFSLHRLSSDAQFMHRYVMGPLFSINDAMDNVARLGSSVDAKYDSDLQALDGFLKEYRSHWQVQGDPRPDARRMADMARAAGRLNLVDQEKRTVDSLEQNVARLPPTGGSNITETDVNRLRSDLRDLLRINNGYLDVAQDDMVTGATRMAIVLLSLGFVGIGLAGALAWRVRRAIAPRIAKLVEKVRTFQEFGVLERAMMQGGDDIAVLGNAIDVGFAAIADRNREHQQFLAVLAHELKTPMVSIIGFVKAARANPERYARALEVVERQTQRLGYLVEDLIWAVNVQVEQLPFHPVPLDLAEVTRHLVDEVSETVPEHAIVVHAPPSAHLLVDEALITHALWSLLTFACRMSSSEAPIDLAVEPSGARVLVRLRVRGPCLSPEDEVHAFEPFSTTQYEDAHPRSAMGLFLCREIARVHGGGLRIEEQAGFGPVLTMDLPA